jgi:hypothetical protein
MHQYDLDTLRLLTHDRTDRRAQEARAERLAREARGGAARPNGERGRLTLIAALRLDIRRNAIR